MGKILRITCLIICSASLGAACSTEGRLIKLDKALYDYQRSMRWGDFQTASKFLDTDTARLSWEQAASYEDIRITQYLIKDRQPSSDGKQYRQTVEIHYYEEPSVTVKTLVDHQHWEFDEKAETWRLVGNLPSFD